MPDARASRKVADCCDDYGFGVADGLPSGTVTFLFTDIEDSSRLWDQYPLQMRVALEQHDALLSAAIESHGGYVFTTAGDSFAAAFQTADQAASAATEIQRVVGAAAWDPATPVRVRIGLHTGEAHERGGDYFGPAVNRAARVEAAGHGGQILTSGVTARVLGQSTTAVWELVDLGEHRLKGLSQPEHIHQLGTGDFAPPATLAESTSHLPSQRAELLGRESDLLAVLEAAGASRLVTLTGLGGIGKTSLALAAAHRLAADSSGPIWWCDLVGAEPRDVVRVIARSIGNEEASLDEAGLAAALRRHGDACLVLDNCEHVLEPIASLVASLLSGTDVRVLATSRLSLGLPDERLVPVAPLDPEGSSVQLFERVMQRVGAATFDDDRPTIERICRRLDGIPLAIELAASRARMLDLTDIEARLERLVSAPSGATGGVDERHRTMAATLAWSVNLLPENLRPGLGALSVFPSRFDLDAAEAILAPEAIDAIDALDVLVGASLLEVNRSGRGIRYRMLEPIRQYAAAELWLDEGRTRDAHLEFFLDKLERAYDHLGTSGSGPYMALVEDLTDLASVHRWALESGRIEDDLRLYRPLASAWMDLGQEVYDWALETVGLPEARGKDGWGAAWQCWAAGYVTSGQDVSGILDGFASVSPDDPTYEFALGGRANLLGIFAGRDWEGALAYATGPPPKETAARLSYYFFGAMTSVVAPASVSGLEPEEAMDQAIAHFYEGLGWAAEIGATNYEVSLLQAMANLLVRNNRVEEGLRVAVAAEELAEALDMPVMRDLCRYHHIVAALTGHAVDRDPFDLLLATLESTLHTGHRGVAAYLNRVAARYLISAAEWDLAAVCLLQPEVGFPDILKPLPDDAIPESAWSSVGERAHEADPLDVAASVLAVLRSVDPVPEPFGV